ncbi:acid protease [Mycena crocata]|nr:acid protease [Mycena crocata]
MFLPAGFLALLLAARLTAAVRISFEQVRRPALQRRNGFAKVNVLATTTEEDDNGLDLSTVHDLIYMANAIYPVQLDTGSSDVWIKGASSPLPNVTDTTTTYNLTYGIGWVFGHIAYAPVEFAGIHVASQVLLDVSDANNPALGYGADGLVGLGFTSLSSIDNVINKTGASTGRSLLFNLFEDNPSEPNFIAFALQRSTDSSDTVQGSFSIGEYEPEYAAVMNATALSTWPITYPSRWNVLLEALLVGSTVVSPVSTVKGVPSNRAVVLLDSGTSYTYAPTAICDAIYGGVPGAQYSSTMGQWIVPCDAEVDIALQFGGEVFPIHPLDVTPTSLGNSSLCVGSFVPQTVSVGAGEFDWLIGDNVLRSVYSIYDFGDFDSSNNMGHPYVKLLALIDPNKASKDFHTARGGTAATNITYNASNTTSTSSSVTVDSDISGTLNKIVAFLPAMLGIMALNAAVLIALIIFGVVLMCRKRKTKATRRKTPGRMSPMPMDPRNSYIAGVEPQPHTYQPPSMAVSEDQLFVPPSPGFRSFDGDSGDRPKSVNYQRQPSEDSLVAPAHSFDDSRPRSVGYQRNPSEEDSIFVASPTATVAEPVILPPPPQRQAPPPPSRQAPQAPQRQPPAPPSPQRQPSRDSVASVRLNDDQFAPGTSPQRIPRRQPSNNLFVPRTFSGRPGDRPQSFAPGADSPALAPPTPAFHTDGGRPKSIA